MSDNELIAEFMGLEFKKEIDGVKYYSVPSGHVASYNASMGQFYYHKSWDWIMPVVEKISKLHDANFKYDMDKIRDGEWPKDDQYMAVIALPMATQIAEAHKAVIEFIHWYNQQKQ